MTDKPKRTDQQNRALHKWLDMLADKLNKQPLSVNDVLNQDFEIPWTVEIVKENAEIMANILNDSGVEIREHIPESYKDRILKYIGRLKNQCKA